MICSNGLIVSVSLEYVWDLILFGQFRLKCLSSTEIKSRHLSGQVHILSPLELGLENLCLSIGGELEEQYDSSCHKVIIHILRITFVSVLVCKSS